MNDREKILKFLKHRADSLHDWALAYESSDDFSKDGPECRARAKILRAQCQIVWDLVQEIKDAMIFEAETSIASAPYKDQRCIVLSEMGGPMDAVILTDPSTEMVHGHSAQDHEALIDFAEGHFELSWVDVPPLELPASGAPMPHLDLRYALVMYRDGGFGASIHNSLMEAQAEEEVWSERYDAGVVDHNNSNALCEVVPVLIPRRSSGKLK